jgi:hypothetical protein
METHVCFALAARRSDAIATVVAVTLARFGEHATVTWLHSRLEDNLSNHGVEIFVYRADYQANDWLSLIVSLTWGEGQNSVTRPGLSVCQSH